MGSHFSVPDPQQERFAAYLDGLAHAAGHADRVGPPKAYCTGLLLPGERKSVEPMRLCAVLIDGTPFKDSQMFVALGIACDGRKTVVGAPLSELLERGLDSSTPRL